MTRLYWGDDEISIDEKGVFYLHKKGLTTSFDSWDIGHKGCVIYLKKGDSFHTLLTDQSELTAMYFTNICNKLKENER